MDTCVVTTLGLREPQAFSQEPERKKLVAAWPACRRCADRTGSTASAKWQSFSRDGQSDTVI